MGIITNNHLIDFVHFLAYILVAELSSLNVCHFECLLWGFVCVARYIPKTLDDLVTFHSLHGKVGGGMA